MSSETFFKRVTPKFGDVTHEEGIHVEQFLSASRSYLEFYDLFGGTVFAPVKSDVSGNIGKLQVLNSSLSQETKWIDSKRVGSKRIKRKQRLSSFFKLKSTQKVQQPRARLLMHFCGWNEDCGWWLDS